MTPKRSRQVLRPYSRAYEPTGHLRYKGTYVTPHMYIPVSETSPRPLGTAFCKPPPRAQRHLRARPLGGGGSQGQSGEHASPGAPRQRFNRLGRFCRVLLQNGEVSVYGGLESIRTTLQGIQEIGGPREDCVLDEHFRPITPNTANGPRREQLLHRNVKRFRGGLVFKAHRWLYHSTLGSRVIKKKPKARPTLVPHITSLLPLLRMSTPPPPRLPLRGG